MRLCICRAVESYCCWHVIDIWKAFLPLSHSSLTSNNSISISQSCSAYRQSLKLFVDWWHQIFGQIRATFAVFVVVLLICEQLNNEREKVVSVGGGRNLWALEFAFNSIKFIVCSHYEANWLARSNFTSLLTVQPLTPMLLQFLHQYFCFLSSIDWKFSSLLLFFHRLIVSISSNEKN